MKLIELQEQIDKGLSQREIATIFSLSQVTIRYWLKKFNLTTTKTKYNSKDKKTEKICGHCNKKLPIADFYKHDNSIHCRNYCRKCQNINSTTKRNFVKLQMLEYKNSECAHCKLSLKNSHPAVFEFHHINPLEKDHNFSSIKGWKWERIIKELDKCILLCANCHRIKHFKQT